MREVSRGVFPVAGGEQVGKGAALVLADCAFGVFTEPPACTRPRIISVDRQGVRRSTLEGVVILCIAFGSNFDDYMERERPSAKTGSGQT